MDELLQTSLEALSINLTWKCCRLLGHSVFRTALASLVAAVYPPLSLTFFAVNGADCCAIDFLRTDACE